MRSWQWSLLGLEVRKLLTYRFNFWTEIFGMSLFQFGVAYYIWSAVFAGSGAAMVGGYSFGAMLFYQLLSPLVGRATYSTDFSGISDEIYTGSLNRYLVYPVTFFVFRGIQQFTTNLVVIFQLAIAVVIFALWLGIPAGVSVHPLQMITFVGVMLVSMFLAFLCSWCIQLAAFWADQVWSLMVSFRFMVHFFGGALIPLGLFPEPVAKILRFLPLYLISGFPIEVFMGRLSSPQILQQLGIAAVWIGVFAFCARLIWRRGLRIYTGVGM